MKNEEPKIEKEFYENGKLKIEATYKSGKKNGVEKGYHENGKLKYKAHWIDGKQDGEVISFDEDGNKIKQSFLKQGSYEGPQKEWWPSGELKADRIMKGGEVFSEKTYSKNGTLVVKEEKIEDIGIVSHHNGKPFTGIMLVEHRRSPMGWSVPVHEEYEMIDGLKDGLRTEFYENGKIKQQTKFSKDKFVNVIGYFDCDGKNLIETDICIEYNMIEEKNDLYYYNDKLYNGSIIHLGGTLSVYSNGIKISAKNFFLDGTVKSISETIDGSLVELKGWIKINDDGDYDENGKKILVREFKDGRKIEYYENGNKKRETDINRKISEKKSDKTFDEIKYYENGNLHIKEVKTKYAQDGMSGGDTIEYSVFYETGELKTEKVDDEKYTIKHISYFKNKKIKSIAVSETRWLHEGHTFEFDEKGNETTKIDAKSEKEIEAREYLKLEIPSKDEISKANKQENERLDQKIAIHIEDLTFETTIGNFENAEPEYAIRDEDGYDCVELSVDNDGSQFYLSDAHDEVVSFFRKFTKKQLVILAEWYGDDDELGDIGIEEIAFINCECPEKLKKYYDGELLITYKGDYLETSSDDYKKINFDDIWENAEIRNSGVECFEFSEWIQF